MTRPIYTVNTQLPDQLSAAMSPIAEATASYMKELRTHGVPKAEALELTRDYQGRLFDGLGLGMC